MELVFRQDGQVIGVVGTSPKTFSTGSRGYFASGKVEADGKRYQVTANIVEIGSKPNGSK